MILAVRFLAVKRELTYQTPFKLWYLQFSNNCMEINSSINLYYVNSKYFEYEKIILALTAIPFELNRTANISFFMGENSLKYTRIPTTLLSCESVYIYASTTSRPLVSVSATFLRVMAYWHQQYRSQATRYT